MNIQLVYMYIQLVYMYNVQLVYMYIQLVYMYIQLVYMYIQLVYMYNVHVALCASFTQAINLLELPPSRSDTIIGFHLSHNYTLMFTSRQTHTHGT